MIAAHPDLLSTLSAHWLAFLAHRGARIEDGLVRDFGAPADEAAAAAQASIVADLGHFGLLAATGDDARAFLHAQVSCDVEGLADDRATWGCYCSPKGRVLANFLLWRMADGFRILLPRPLLAGIQQRLQKFVLRAKVTLTERTGDEVALGLAGNAALHALGAPQVDMAVTRHEATTAICLPGPRFIVVAAATGMPDIWERVAPPLKPVGTSRWAWLDIVHGVPWIGPATQDEFVPQMADLDSLGAINFRKGCYPGQEIVARTQYLGTPKRRLAVAHVPGERAPAEGESLIAHADDLDQSAGTVLNAAAAPAGGFDLLAVVQTARRATPICLGTRSGPLLEFRALPYGAP